MPRNFFKSMLPALKSLDMFGYVPQLNFKGHSTFTTYPGMVVSILIYGLIVMNTVQLAISFNNGSKQNEKFNSEHVRRFETGPQYFSENQFEIAIVTNKPVPEEMGRVVAYQYGPCQKEDGNCKSWQDRVRAVPFESCNEERQGEIRDHWIKVEGSDRGQKYTDNALCLDMNGTYLAGERMTNTEASLVIAFERHPDIITDPEASDYDEASATFFYKTFPAIHASYNQVDMKTGTFSRVIRLLGITQVPEVELSMNTLIDRNDYLGLFYSEPEPQPFFSFDKKENE